MSYCFLIIKKLFLYFLIFNNYNEFIFDKTFKNPAFLRIFSDYIFGLQVTSCQFQILVYQSALITMPCSFHSSHSRLVISGNWVRSCGLLNPPSSSLKTIIFQARGSVICKMCINHLPDK